MQSAIVAELSLCSGVTVARGRTLTNESNRRRGRRLGKRNVQASRLLTSKFRFLSLTESGILTFLRDVALPHSVGKIK